MDVRVVTDLAGFDALRSDWDRLFQVDPEATVHRSWAWMKAWAATTELTWRVLCAVQASSGDCVGLFPIALQKDDVPGANGMRTKTVLFPGGHPLAAHTGFLCKPDCVKQVLRVWREYLTRHVTWDEFRLKDVLDSRLPEFIDGFRSFRFSVRSSDPTTCPTVTLPSRWEDYLSTNVGSETRKTYRKRFSRLERSAEITVCTASEETLDECLDALLTLWQLRWGQQPLKFVTAVKSILSSCFENGLLHLRVMRAHGTPIAAVAVYMDPHHKTAQCFMSGYDDAFSRLSPGNMLIFDSVNAAIDLGMSEYNFGRGPQNYKYSVFGARDKYNSNVTVLRVGVAKKLKSKMRMTLNKFVL